jgi:hypothetical protein
LQNKFISEIKSKSKRVNKRKETHEIKNEVNATSEKKIKIPLPQPLA